LQIASTSSSDTEKLGEQLGSKLRGGEVIELISDLGGGKTTLVRGLSKGMGSTDRVSSPTFTISKLYKSDNLELHHFDFYRLGEAGLIAHELEDVLNDPNCVVVVEWGGVVSHVLPDNRLSISIKRTGEDARRIDISCPESLAYIAEDLDVDNNN
jgi:tRNA threonylcarbamoyladenosine biosynthesis protein TsaE